MYHHVGPLPNNADAIRTGLTVLPDNFEQQLQFYKAKGYQSVDFYQMYYAITLGWDLPPKPMIFTFDDAYQDVYDFAFPIMKKYGYTGTIFVPTQFIDEGRADYMSWDELMEMHAAGWRLEPHTKTHEDVTNRKRDWLIYQIYGSMDTLRYHLGYQPRFFAYPSGAHDDKAIAVLKEVGFWGAVTTDGEWYHDLKKAYIWGRVRIGGDYVLKDIANLLGEKYP
jgi:peptidoglycan/xylan/chitin deacetylase (PgdA/CDA1 family)